jgi:hypothetical protein
MEASYWHLPIKAFHGGFLKVKGKADWFMKLLGKTATNSYAHAMRLSMGKVHRRYFINYHHNPCKTNDSSRAGSIRTGVAPFGVKRYNGALQSP